MIRFLRRNQGQFIISLESCNLCILLLVFACKYEILYFHFDIKATQQFEECSNYDRKKGRKVNFLTAIEVRLLELLVN